MAETDIEYRRVQAKNNAKYEKASNKFTSYRLSYRSGNQRSREQLVRVLSKVSKGG